MSSTPSPFTWFSQPAFALLTFAILAFVVLSPFGRALKAVRDDETAAEILGKNAYRFKIKSFVIGSVFAGLAGVLWAHYATFISPGDFTLTETILVLLIVVMGGKGTLPGTRCGGRGPHLLPGVGPIPATPSRVDAAAGTACSR